MHTTGFFESIFRKGRKLMMTEQVREVIRKKFSIRRLKLSQTQEK